MSYFIIGLMVGAAIVACATQPKKILKSDIIREFQRKPCRADINVTIH